MFALTRWPQAAVVTVKAGLAALDATNFVWAKATVAAALPQVTLLTEAQRAPAWVAFCMLADANNINAILNTPKIRKRNTGRTIANSTIAFPELLVLIVARCAIRGFIPFSSSKLM